VNGSQSGTESWMSSSMVPLNGFFDTVASMYVRVQSLTRVRARWQGPAMTEGELQSAPAGTGLIRPALLVFLSNTHHHFGRIAALLNQLRHCAPRRGVCLKNSSSPAQR
jgi:hypothetical protein